MTLRGRTFRQVICDEQDDMADAIAMMGIDYAHLYGDRIVVCGTPKGILNSYYGIQATKKTKVTNWRRKIGGVK